MFTRFRVENFRTHLDTSIELGQLTLLVGANNSGKSNLLAALEFVSDLTRRALAESPAPIEDEVLADQLHRLWRERPLRIECEWRSSIVRVRYSVQVEYSACSEELEIHTGKEVHKESNQASSCLPILPAHPPDGLEPAIRQGRSKFFRELSSIASFDPEASVIKGLTVESSDTAEGIGKIGPRGRDMAKALLDLQANDIQVYNDWAKLMRRFEPSLVGVQPVEEFPHGIGWIFDYGGRPLDPWDRPAFDSARISDGVLKAAAVAYAVVARPSPSVLLCEEIENGISPQKLDLFFSWLDSAGTQVILTSHSPSLLRAFHDRLNCVYHFRLQRRDYRSVVTNLNTSLKELVKLGSIPGEIEQEDDRELVVISPDDLTRLWYSGAIGAELPQPVHA